MNWMGRKQAKEILPAFIYLIYRLNLDYKLPKKKKASYLWFLRGLRENIVLYKGFCLQTGLPVKETVRQESDQIHTREKQRQKQDCIKTKT